MMLFADRRDAGRQLSELLDDDTVKRAMWWFSVWLAVECQLLRKSPVH